MDGVEALQMGLFVVWARAANGYHHRLGTVPLSELAGVGGVYLMWTWDRAPAWIAAGEAPDLARRLRGLQRVEALRTLDSATGLYVTWAAVDPCQRPGVGRYLVEAVRPRVARAGRTASPLPVNLPN